MTTAPALDTVAHSAAIRAALKPQLGEHNAYDYDDVPADLPDIYVALTVEMRYTPPRRATGQVGRSGWRVALRSVGRTVDEARWAQKRVMQALHEQTLTVNGYASTLLQHESWSDAEEDSGGRWSGLNVLTYAV